MPPREPAPFAVDPTIDLSRRDPGSGADRLDQPVEIVPEGAGLLSAETQSLLRGRLRAAASILALGFFLSLLRHLFPANADPAMRAGHLVALAVQLVILAVLSGRRPLSLRQLRGLELAIFGSTVAYFAAFHYRVAVLRLRQGDPLLAMATSKNLLHSYFTVIVTYGLFIPNTWRRTATVVTLIAVVPVAVNLIVRIKHPELLETAASFASSEQMADNVLRLLMGMVIAIYGAHIVGALRAEAFEARQLGQYRLRHRIGTGGMGEVYLAEHRLLKRPCAIKLIRPGRSDDPKMLARFEREVRSTARLSHWNTVEIYDYGRTEDGLFYYVMEYLPGLNLAELVARFGPLPPERAIHLLRQACDALREAHDAGLIHRDLKPANIFASRRGGLHDVAKLLDFGLVKPTAGPDSAQLSQEGDVTGSPAYMSPEQATGDQPPDRRSDIYSLGAVAYYLLTGRAPFEGESPIRLLIAHARDPVVPPSRLRPDIPADLESVILRCLLKSPDDRFQDADELERALAACADAGRWTQDRAARWWAEVEVDTPSASPAP